MKTILIVALSVLALSVSAQSDTTSVSLKAAGLTCSLCSKTVYKSLLKVPSVSKVDPDIKNSSYTVYFKKGYPIKLEELNKAVKDAGFSVASMKVNVNKNKTDR
jgi:copper chaperone CopZ